MKKYLILLLYLVASITSVKAQDADIRTEFLSLYDGIEFNMTMIEVSSLLLQSRAVTLEPFTNDGLHIVYKLDEKVRCLNHVYDVYFHFNKGYLKGITFRNEDDYEAASASVVSYIYSGRFALYGSEENSKFYFLDKKREIVGCTIKNLLSFSILFVPMDEQMREKFE